MREAERTIVGLGTRAEQRSSRGGGALPGEAWMDGDRETEEGDIEDLRQRVQTPLDERLEPALAGA